MEETNAPLTDHSNWAQFHKMDEPWMAELIKKLTGDMKIIGVINMIMGFMSCLSIIGAIYGIPVVIYSNHLLKSADAFRDSINAKNTDALIVGLERLRSYFFINKVLLLIGVVITTLYLLFMIIFFGFIASSFSEILPIS